jgi:hypothetical protein
VAVDLAALQTFAHPFHGQPFRVHDLPVGSRFFRLMETKYGDLLGYGPGSSRFSDPRHGTPGVSVFCVVYGAQDLATAFEEVILRDTTDGQFAPHVRPLSGLRLYHGGFFRSTAPVRLVDLSVSGGLRLVGVPTDIVRYSSHRLSQSHAYAVHAHPARFDGIRYRSRFSGKINVAIFDRALHGAFTAEAILPLTKYDIRPILRALHIQIDAHA